MEIIKGIIHKAKKVVVYGPEGVGKSSLAAAFPNPVFIDTEGSTDSMDVCRISKPTSWEMLKNIITDLKNSKEFATIVIDTVDWAEQLCIRAICDRYQKKGIEDFGYGNGYVYEKEEFEKFLNLLQDIVDSGINVVLTAHAHIKKFEQPDEASSYDRWELKLGKKTGSQISPLVKEWADMVLFANFKTFSVAVDKEGKKHKAQGGERVMYTTHHPCWDAKNRYNLPPELPLDYSCIAHIFEQSHSAPVPASAQPIPQSSPSMTEQVGDLSGYENVPTEDFNPSPTEVTKPPIPPDIPKPLADLMQANGVTEDDIRLVVSQFGYYTFDTPVSRYDPQFIDGYIIGAWSDMLPLIRENQKAPF